MLGQVVRRAHFVRSIPSDSMENDDLIEAINALLGEPEEYDPVHPAFIRPAEAPSQPPVATVQPTVRVAMAGYRRGHLVQPSDHRNRAKNAWMTQPPPTPPHRPAPTNRQPTEPSRPTLEPIRVYGPAPPPPIPVEVEPGIVVDVPHFAIHVSRQYKARIGHRRWHLRFDRCGRLRACREKSRPPAAAMSSASNAGAI